MKEGPPAVEPLLDCLANDRRLTRAAGFITVDQAAFEVLHGILGTWTFGPLTEHGYRYYPAFGKRPSVEWQRDCRRGPPLLGKGQRTDGAGKSWFSVLADCRQRPNNGWKRPRRSFDRTEGLRRGAFRTDRVGHPGCNRRDSRPLAGEAPRAKKDPSVTELLVQRSDESAELAKRNPAFFFDLEPGCELAVRPAQRDTKASVPVVHRRFASLRPAMRK